jgi:hypothetical protein
VKIITYGDTAVEGKITNVNSATDRGDMYFGIGHYGDLDNDGEENQKGCEAAVPERRLISFLGVGCDFRAMLPDVR